MRRFMLIRARDTSGVSGTGIVAEGVEFSDETCVLRWHGEHKSTVIWPSIKDVLAVHGHSGDTEIGWVDNGGVVS